MHSDYMTHIAATITNLFQSCAPNKKHDLYHVFFYAYPHTDLILRHKSFNMFPIFDIMLLMKDIILPPYDCNILPQREKTPFDCNISPQREKTENAPTM